MANLNYAGNSDNQQNRTPKPKIVSCEVKGQSETKMGKLKSIFIAEDVSNVKDYMWNSVILPNLKAGLVDMVANLGDILVNSFSMMINGSPARGVRNGNGIGHFNYNGCFVEPRSANVEKSKKNDIQTAVENGETNFIFPSKNDAEQVLQYLYGELKEYGTTTVADLYDAIGKTVPRNWQASNVGWRNLDQAYITHSYGGYMLVLPRPERL